MILFNYLAPSSTTDDTDELFGGDVTGVSDAHFRMLSGGAFAEAGFDNTFLLDGGSVSTTSTYPVDGKTHSVKLTSNSTLSISALVGKQAATDTYSGIMYNFIIRDSGGTIKRKYNIDQTWIGPSTELTDTSGNNQHGTAVNIDVDDSELFTQEGIDWLGEETITNGKFDTDTGWTKGTNVTISGGKANASATADSIIDQTALPLQANKRYYIVYTISNYVSGTIISAVSGANGVGRTANGTYMDILDSLGGNFQMYALASATCSIDDISVKRILQGTL